MAETPHPALAFLPHHEVEKEFARARAQAIESYSLVEQSLVRLFSDLLGISIDFAGVPFFRINNARARNAMLDRLLTKRRGSEYNLFFNSLVKQLRGLDDRRNQIVHWSTMLHIDANNVSTHVTLIAPNFWDRTSGSEERTLTDLYDFIIECRFVSQILKVFSAHVFGGDPTFFGPTWREIFQQPIVYPPPSNHPLYLTT